MKACTALDWCRPRKTFPSDILAVETERERAHQGSGNTILMRLCCVQLFNLHKLEDVLPIWHAKTASWDAYRSIDIQLLCGAGLEATKEYLAQDPSPEAHSALERIIECEHTGDFDGFSVAAYWGYFVDEYS